jgi:hypothetical protein
MDVGEQQALRGCFDHMMKGFIEGDYCVPLYHIKRMEVRTEPYIKPHKLHVLIIVWCA